MGWGIGGGGQRVLELKGRKNAETSEGFRLAETGRVADLGGVETLDPEHTACSPSELLQRQPLLWAVMAEGPDTCGEMFPGALLCSR